MNYVEYSKQRSERMRIEQTTVEQRFLSGEITNKEFLNSSKKIERACIRDLHRFRGA